MWMRMGFIATALLASQAAAQGKVWVVDDDGGPGVDFTVLQDAADAAADGDTILVKDGVYSQGALGLATLGIVGKSLVVTAEKGALVRVTEGKGWSWMALHVGQLTAEQTVILRGIRFEVGGLVWAGHPALLFLENDGSILMEDCEVWQGYLAPIPPAAMHVVRSSQVVLTRCYLSSERPASPIIRLEDSSMSLHGTEVRGADGIAGPDIKNDGGDAILLTGGQLFVAGGALRGGDGQDAIPNPTCYPGGDGGDAIEATASAIAIVDAALVGGSTGAAVEPGCADGLPGLPLKQVGGSLVQAPGPARTAQVDSPVREGDDAVVVLTGVPGETAYLFVSLGGMASTYVPLLSGVVVVSNPLDPFFLGPVPVGGTLSWNTPLGSLPAGAGAATVHLQGLLVDPSLLTVAITSNSALTILDSTL